MRRVLRPVVLAGLVLGAVVALRLAGGAGSAPADDPRFLVTSLPAGAAAEGRVPGRLPAGARVELVAGDRVGVLAPGLAAAGDPAVDTDGVRIALAGRDEAAGTDGLWVLAVVDADPQPVPGLPANCATPAWLPDGRLAFVAAVDDGRALHAAAVDGGEVRRLTFFADGEDLDPAVLPDGRILFAHREAGTEGTVLYTVHVDGSGIEAWHGAGDRATLRRRPRPVPGRAVVYTAAGGLRRVDARRPQRAATAVLPDVGAAAALPGGDWLLARPPGDDRATWGVVRAGPEDAVRTVVRDAPDRDEVDAVPLVAGARAQGHLSMVKPDAGTGWLLVVDARRATGARADAVAGATHARLHADGVLLGDVPLAADGSLFAEVPADRPLALQLLAADGRVLADSGPRFWVRPNESRACLGCHEHPGETPPNARPLALGPGPVDLSVPGGAR